MAASKIASDVRARWRGLVCVMVIIGVCGVWLVSCDAVARAGRVIPAKVRATVKEAERVLRNSCLFVGGLLSSIKNIVHAAPKYFGDLHGEF